MKTDEIGRLNVLVGPPSFKTERLLIESKKWDKLEKQGKCDIIGFHRQKESIERLTTDNLSYFIEGRYYRGPLKIQSYIKRDTLNSSTTNEEHFYVVAVDDCQFEDQQPDVLAYTLDTLANDGNFVIAAGVDQNSEGDPYTATAYLLALADNVEKHTARCSKCGALATKSAYIKSKDFIPAGKNNEEKPLNLSVDAFEPRCKDCWTNGKIGQLTVICGPMFSGKTLTLLKKIDYLERKNASFEVFVPDVVAKNDDNSLISQGICDTPIQVEAEGVKNSTEILEYWKDNHYEYVLIDEAQFFDSSLVENLEEIIQGGSNVVIAGIEVDFQAKPFMPVPRLMAIADVIEKQTSLCEIEGCTNEAVRTMRTSESTKRILVGGKEDYKAVCRKHFTEHLENRLGL